MILVVVASVIYIPLHEATKAELYYYVSKCSEFAMATTQWTATSQSTEAVNMFIMVIAKFLSIMLCVIYDITPGINQIAI